VEHVYLAGVCTSICVMETVADLRNRDYSTFIFRRGVADFDQEPMLLPYKGWKKSSAQL